MPQITQEQRERRIKELLSELDKYPPEQHEVMRIPWSGGEARYCKVIPIGADEVLLNPDSHRLKSQLQGQLAPITNGRYRDVRIGEDLALQVKTQDQRAYKDVDSLSLGTRSLIYLLERLALARIIGGNAEPPPLLLDEALVHADRRRMRAAMDELGRLGQEHQIILFSKEEGLADRAEKADDWTIIRLPGPSLIAASPEAAPANGSARDQVEEEVPS